MIDLLRTQNMQELLYVFILKLICFINTCLFVNQIPPAPPRPDFEASREKLQRLGEESERNFSKEEFQKMKSELEAEYLATFKKTVAMHEVFLQRLGAHPGLKNDSNFQVFLEYEGEVRC